MVDLSSSGDGQREGGRELSSHSQSARAFGSNSQSERAGSQENTLDDDIKQYTRIQILTLEHKQPPPQQEKSGVFSSYWTVPEQTDFYNLLRYFGTDWQAIARSLKTKPPIMVSFSLPSIAIGCTNIISRSKIFTIEKSRKAILASIWRTRLLVQINYEQKG